MLDRSLKRLHKKARRGMRGYPVGAVAAYGPDDRRASKVVASVIAYEGGEPETREWLSAHADVRNDPGIAAEILAFFEESGVMSVAMPDRIIGCPHQEGIDYEGDYCPDPACTFWIGRDRWTGKMVR
ncbi:MAG TPA: hypothetical protein VME47_07210 [Acetobacteraceae bacterium]|nr:hypothetical protein [Acetobacteraceae bacterium]